MNVPQRDDTSQLTGVEHLSAALAVQDAFHRGRYAFTAIGAVEQHATKGIDQALTASGLLTPQSDLTHSELRLQARQQPWTALEVFRAFHRGVVGAPNTLAALSKGTQSPVHGSERMSLAAAIRRRLISDGYDIDEAGAVKALYAVATAVGACLAGPVEMPARAHTLVPVQVDGPIGDHDEVDWRTGEPKHDTAAATRSALAAVLAATSDAPLEVAA